MIHARREDVPKKIAIPMMDGKVSNYHEMSVALASGDEIRGEGSRWIQDGV